MAFRFRVQPVLHHRQRLEDARALDLARARQQLESTGGRLAALSTETAAWTRLLAATAARGSTGVELARLARDVEQLHTRTGQAHTELEAQRHRAEQARRELVEAARGRRIIQLLEASARAAHARRVEYLEQRQTDEAAAAGYLWRRREANAVLGGRDS